MLGGEWGEGRGGGGGGGRRRVEGGGGGGWWGGWCASGSRGRPCLASAIGRRFVAFHARQLVVQPNGNGLPSIVEVTAVPESGRRSSGVIRHDKVAAMAG